MASKTPAPDVQDLSPDVFLTDPDAVINHENAVLTKRKGESTVDRAATDHLRDDPEARRAFLSTFTAEDETRIMRKVDKRFFVLAGLMFFFKQLDTQNTSSVKVLQVGEPTNILKQLHMTSNQYNWVATSYQFGYMFFEPPSVLIFKWMLPHRFMSRIYISWGFVLTLNAVVKNRQGFYAVRFFLGVLEAGMFPGAVAHLASWYRTEEFQRPMAWFFAIQVCANFVGPLICFGMSYMNGLRGLSAWQWVFILEGVATIIFGFVLWALLPDYPKSPRSDRFLTKREQEFVETRLSENAPQTDDPNFSKKEIIASLKDPTMWTFLFSQMFVNTGGGALTWYLPTIITSLGYTKLPMNQLMTLPPAIASVFGIIFISWVTWKAWIVRPALIMIVMAGMVVCFVLFFTIDSPGGIYAACILGSLFYYMFFPPYWSWRGAVLKGSTGTIFSLGFQNGINQIAGLISPQFFQEKYAHNRYKTSFAIAAAFIIAAVFTNLASWWLTRNLEFDILRIARLQKAAEKQGRIYVDDDYQVFEQRKYYQGVKNLKKKELDIELAEVKGS